MNTSRKPAIGMILKGYPRISETFISNEILLLEQHGFSIHIFSMRKPRESFAHASVGNIRASVDYLPERLLSGLPRLLYHNVLLASKTPRIYADSLKIGLKRFARSRKMATIKHLLQAGYLVHHLLPRRKCSHIHAHFAHSPTSVAMFAARMNGLSFSFTAHAKDIYTTDPVLLREKIDTARFVVTCTGYNQTYLKGLCPDRGASIHRIYHGISTELFSSNQPVKPPVKPFQILTVARLTAKKGLPTVLYALRRLCDQGLSIQHTLIGDGDDRQLILKLIRDLRLSNVTRWLGTQTHEVVLQHYRESDLFVLGCEQAPNGDRDGIPNVLLESMAMGVPVVATTISAIPELICNGKTGLLVPPKAPEKMAEAIFRLLTDMDLRHRIIPAAKEQVLKNFNNKDLVRDLAALFGAIKG